MRILNIRKYIFTNIIVLWFYYFLFINIPFYKAIFINKIPLISDVLIGWIALCILYTLIFAGIFILAILEIIIRKNLLEKKSWFFRLTNKFKIPKPIIYNLQYHILFRFYLGNNIIYRYFNITNNE